MRELIAVLLFVGGMALVIALIIFLPLMVIWAINTIFGLAIITTFKVWCAVWLLVLCVNMK